MSRGEEFEELRPLLFAIAYRMVAEAEDAVQDAWLLSGRCTELSREGLHL
jgi:RNA polymerase sigma-70 factor, ECF subfamily